MRLQLILAAALATAPAAAAAQAEDTRRGEAGLRVYADDDDVTVWSPSASVVVPLSEAAVVQADATMDAITAASIDVTSTASPYAFTEQRIEGTLAGRVAVRDLHWLGLRATFSDERDYTSLRLGASWFAELARRNTTLELGYDAGFDTVGRAGDPRFAAPRRGHRLLATLTQVTDRAGYLDVVLDVDRSTGLLSSPYRYVPIEVGGMAAYSLPERVPGARTSLAALVRVRRAVADVWFAHADYRLCRDTWDLTSHTATARATRSLRDDELLLGVELRGYLQSGASFHRAAYAGDDGAPTWRTRDRSLGPMRTVSAGGVAQLLLPWHEAGLTGSLAWARFTWPGDPLQRRRDALIASFALHLPF